MDTYTSALDPTEEVVTVEGVDEFLEVLGQVNVAVAHSSVKSENSKSKFQI